MRATVRFMTVMAWVFALGTTLAQAEQTKLAQPAVDPAKEAAMKAVQQAGSPSEGHKALEPLIGTWNYTMSFWMSPDAAPQSMTGTTTNTLILGGRFLKQEVRGQAEGQPPFEGMGYTGYDNLRKEYQSVWFDNMATGIMVSTGQFDPTTMTMTEQGDFSCPMTGQAHQQFRTVWKITDPTHSTYESYTHTPDGHEFKSMEIHYTRAQ